MVSRSRCPSVSSLSPFLLVSLPSFRHACPSTLFRFYLWARPLTSRRIVIKVLCVFLAEYIRVSFRFSLVLEVMEGWRTRRRIYRRINCNSRAMCCGKSRLEALETKETLLFNVDKLDRLYPNWISKNLRRIFYSILFYSQKNGYLSFFIKFKIEKERSKSVKRHIKYLLNLLFTDGHEISFDTLQSK